MSSHPRGEGGHQGRRLAVPSRVTVHSDGLMLGTAADRMWGDFVSGSPPLPVRRRLRQGVVAAVEKGGRGVGWRRLQADLVVWSAGLAGWSTPGDEGRAPIAALTRGVRSVHPSGSLRVAHAHRDHDGINPDHDDNGQWVSARAG